MKRFYALILPPALSVAVFLVEVLRRHGYEAVGGPLWVAVGLLIAGSVFVSWLAYAPHLQRFAGLGRDRALLLDLVSYLPFLWLWAYWVPAVRQRHNIATLLFFGALAALIVLRAAPLLYCRRERLRALWAQPWAVLGLIVGVAFLLRVTLISANRFHVDEALYAHWGLMIASGQDIFLKTEIVDKPPVFFYILALSFKLFGSSETAARLPNLLASLAGIALVYGIARDLYDRRAAALGALFLAFSPYDIQYAPTAFTDPLMVTLALAAVFLALRGRHGWAGLALGLAIMTKPTAILFLPLLLYAAARSLRGANWRGWGEAGRGLGVGVAAVALPVFLWDRVIRVGSPSFLDAGVVHYGGMGLVSPADLWPRLQAWLVPMQYLTGARLLNLALVVGVPLLLLYGLWQRRTRPGWAADWALAGLFAFYVAVHTALSFQIWERYLLGLAPVAAILLARVALLPFDLAAAWPRPAVGRVAYGAFLGLFLAATLAGPARTALAYGFPIGGDDGKYQGIDELAAYLRATVPSQAVVFQRVLGWHLSYYLFGRPLDIRYYPTAEDLLAMVQRLPDREKYIVFPSWTGDEGVGACLRRAGWELQETYRVYRPNGSVSFIVYRIRPSPPGGRRGSRVGRL